MISHITLEIDKSLVPAELGFWAILGYKRLQRTRAMGRTEWLRSWGGLAEEGLPSSWVHLVPVEHDDVPGSRFGTGGRGHPAVVVGSQFERVCEELSRSDHGLVRVEPHWGERAFTRCPSGHRVEILSNHPAAKWPGAPVSD